MMVEELNVMDERLAIDEALVEIFENTVPLGFTITEHHNSDLGILVSLQGLDGARRGDVRHRGYCPGVLLKRLSDLLHHFDLLTKNAAEQRKSLVWSVINHTGPCLGSLHFDRLFTLLLTHSLN